RRGEARQAVGVALERMARELREAGYDPASAGIAALVVAEPTRVVLQRDLDGDGVIDTTRERVTYLLRPGETTLRRDAGAGAQPIADGVRRLAFSYFDRDGAATTDPATVAAVRIELEAGRDMPAALMGTHVMLRNAPFWVEERALLVGWARMREVPSLSSMPAAFLVVLPLVACETLPYRGRSQSQLPSPQEGGQMGVQAYRQTPGSPPRDPLDASSETTRITQMEGWLPEAMQSYKPR